MGIYWELTIILEHPSPVRHFISVKADWLELYIGCDFGNIHYCYLAEIVTNSTGPKLIILGRHIQRMLISLNIRMFKRTLNEQHYFF